MSKSLPNSNELAAGWITTLLSEISEINMGQSPPSETYNNIGKGLPFFQGKAEFTELHPVVEKWCSQPNKIAETNDILLSVRAPVGTTNIANQRCCIGRGLAAIRYTPNHKFLFYYLRLIEKKLDEKGTGTTLKAISGEVLRNININVPPLPEQHAIVSKIEQLFSELDKGIESLKTAQQQLKVYRQSVLKWAFEGKLTERWRQNQELPDAQKLFEKIQKEWEEKAKASSKKSKPVASLTKEEMAALPVLPKEWVWVNIERIIDTDKYSLKAGPFGSSLKKEFYVQKGYKIYGQEQVIAGNSFYGDYYISKEKFEELISNKIQPHDILISLVGTVGKVLILPENCEHGIINPRLIKVTLNRNYYNPQFFKYYFESSLLKSLYSSKAQGTTMDVLNLGIIKTLRFPLCSLPEQHQIVQEIESRLSECDNMGATIGASLQQAGALRQSILKKAFEGRLLNEKELEAVRQDPTWEPAERLLERIRVEKAVLHSGKKGRKSKSGVKCNLK